LKTSIIPVANEIGRKSKQRVELSQVVLSSIKSLRKRYISSRTKAPTHGSCEIPILCVLEKSPTAGLRTSIALKEIESKWFKELTTVDLSAVYPVSRRKIVDTIIKYSKKIWSRSDKSIQLSERTWEYG